MTGVEVAPKETSREDLRERMRNNPFGIYEHTLRLRGLESFGIEIIFQKDECEETVLEMLGQRPSNVRFKIDEMDASGAVSSSHVIDTAEIMMANLVEGSEELTFEGRDNFNRLLAQAHIDHALGCGKDPEAIGTPNATFVAEVTEERPLDVWFLDDNKRMVEVNFRTGDQDHYTSLLPGESHSLDIKLLNEEHEEITYRVRISSEGPGSERTPGLDDKLARMLLGGIGMPIPDDLDESVERLGLFPIRTSDALEGDLF